MHAKNIICFAFVLVLVACMASPKMQDLPSARPTTDHSPDGPVRAIILALHGMNDYRTAFDFVGEYMKERSIRVVAYDQRGFGENPDWGFWPGNDALANDIIGYVNELKSQNPDIPIFLLGGSMGAAVAIIAKSRAPNLPVDGIILSGPAVWGGDALNPVYRAVLWLARRIVPNLTLTGHSLKRQASDNIDALIQLGRDPLVIKETTVAAIGGLVDLMTEARAQLPTLEGRFFVPRGAKDEIIPPETQADVARLLAKQECTTAVYPNGWHMLMRDHQRDVLFADIVAWMDNQELPSGFGEKCKPQTSEGDLRSQP